MKTLRHEFVQYMPDRLEDGVIYISMQYRLAVHKCVCGCGNQVTTPFSPTDWELRFYGDSISLSPSIGNWSFDCQSHYWIVKNQIRFVSRWNYQQINDGRAKDKKRKRDYYSADVAKTSEDCKENKDAAKPGSKLKRLKSLFSFLKD